MLGNIFYNGVFAIKQFIFAVDPAAVENNVGLNDATILLTFYCYTYSYAFCGDKLN